MSGLTISENLISVFLFKQQIQTESNVWVNWHHTLHSSPMFLLFAFKGQPVQSTTFRISGTNLAPPHHKAFPDHSGQGREPFNSRYHSYIFLFFHPLIQSTHVMGYAENLWVTPDIILLYCELILLHVFLCSDSDNLKSRDFLIIQNCKKVRIWLISTMKTTFF